ncbi:hypothetical protein F2P45_13485 [Massilia sp. CCM 8733]|uniref:Uncharacterized protein n=1 Tax=Massilia mucilaginosa TaxID=2609282 RepID=A0ABX0NSX4_9BURK|nr:hypothetical protein [Massilia mucilaginosa]
MLLTEVAAGQDQVSESKQGQALRLVAGQAAIARFAMFEQALYAMEAVLNLGARGGLRVFQFVFGATQRIFAGA